VCGNHDVEVMCAERYGWTMAQTLSENSRTFLWELTARWEAEHRRSKKERKKKPRRTHAGFEGGRAMSMDEIMAYSKKG
jgi:hypothetical protein